MICSYNWIVTLKVNWMRKGDAEVHDHAALLDFAATLQTHDITGVIEKEVVAWKRPRHYLQNYKRTTILLLP